MGNSMKSNQVSVKGAIFPDDFKKSNPKVVAFVGKNRADEFYKNQMIHRLGNEEDRVRVKIFIDES